MAVLVKAGGFSLPPRSWLTWELLGQQPHKANPGGFSETMGIDFHPNTRATGGACQPRRRRVGGAAVKVPGGGLPPGGPRDGNPRFLNVMPDCLAQEGELLGLRPRRGEDSTSPPIVAFRRHAPPRLRAGRRRDGGRGRGTGPTVPPGGLGGRPRRVRWRRAGRPGNAGGSGGVALRPGRDSLTARPSPGEALPFPGWFTAKRSGKGRQASRPPTCRRLCWSM
jgi:hypothetical protein